MFEWDERKRLANIAKHGVDFEQAKLIFDGPTLEGPDDRLNYGERRIGAYGEVDGDVLFVIYTRRGGRRRLISARKAGSDEGKRITRALRTKATVMMDQTDKKRLRALTDADIEKAVADDPDTFIPDAAWWKRARVVLPGAKEMVTLRLDPDVLAWFRKSGRGYQTRINAVLRAFVEAQK